jgi:hypothetical protein
VVTGAELVRCGRIADVRWSEAPNHATRLADQGHDVTILVHTRSDGSVARTATIRVAKSGINDLAAFFTESGHQLVVVAPINTRTAQATMMATTRHHSSCVVLGSA